MVKIADVVVIVREFTYKLADNCELYMSKRNYLPAALKYSFFLWLGSPSKICKVTLGSLVSLPVFASHKG